MKAESKRVAPVFGWPERGGTVAIIDVFLIDVQHRPASSDEEREVSNGHESGELVPCNFFEHVEEELASNHTMRFRSQQSPTATSM